MSQLYITADEHYGHRNIIKYCTRPFSDTDHMREELIARHNQKVPNSKNVLTIHIGDMFWNSMDEKDAYDIIHRLNGRHAFIFGNHDELMERSQWLCDQFDWIVGKNKASGIEIVNFNNMKIILCHYAMRVWWRSHKGSGMLFGHSHNELPVVGRSFDVGVDGHDFFPWSVEEAHRKLESMPYSKIPADKIWPGKETHDHLEEGSS
jgi:calcineurin-like phosphoesterase family protein